MHIHDLAALLTSLQPDTIEYPAEIFRVARELPEGLLKRKLQENLTGWINLTAEERNARHIRAVALVHDALKVEAEGREKLLPDTNERPGDGPTLPVDNRRSHDENRPRNDESIRSNGEESAWEIDLSPISPSLWRETAQTLALPLTKVKGIGAKRAEALATKGVSCIGDLLTYLPFRYDLRTERTTLRGVPPGQGVLVSGHVLARGPVRMRRFPQAYRIEIGLDGNERVSAVWFRMSRPQKEFFARNYPTGAAIEAAGQLEFFDGRPSFMHPELGKPGTLERGLLPVYSETEGITTKSLRQWVATALDMVAGRVTDPFPPELRQKYALIPKERALRDLHRPANPHVSPLDPLYPPRRRLVFEEFFTMSLGLLIRRRGTHKEKGLPHAEFENVVRAVEAGLPFPLTGAQRRAIADIGRDLLSGHPMHRLVQGDVGSGKTLVALIAAAISLKAGYQVAFMAPTELLAEQHFRNAEKFLRSFGLQIALLTGSTPAKARRELAARLQSGAPLLVVGTHALLENDAAFSNLALAIVDEQHRFGVRQRAKLAAKGSQGLIPHFLVMTATPIPRTLAMTLYGDLDVSVIDELPPGRTPIETKLVVTEADRKALMTRVKAALADGEQVYWVFPLIEESEKIELKDATRAAELLQKALPDTKVELLHGRMSPEEKDAVMGRFLRGQAGVLVATTVIEVGVDVPNASIMVVEHADRFGLSQLHQLRGRVGRGAAKSTCFLRTDNMPRGDVAHRLDVMTETNDGFRIAEADLEIRGAGDLLGTKQSGLPSLHVANPVRDAKTLAEAREAAERLLQIDPDLRLPEHEPIRAMLEQAWSGRLHLATAG